MKIIKLTAENFKRLHAVEINAEGSSVVELTGRNCQGKTSILDAIAAALGGKNTAPKQPIKKGAAKAQVIVDLGDLRVTRRWTAADKSSLIVEGKDGARYQSPQAMLDKLVGELSFDPLAFSRMDPKAQAAMLRQLVGLDVSALEAERARVYEERTEVGRRGKMLDGQLSGIIVPEAPAAVGEEKSVAGLLKRQREAAEAMRINDRVRQATADAHQAEADGAAAVERLEQHLAEAKAKHSTLISARTAAEDKERALVDPDLAALDAEVAGLEEHNAGVRAARAQIERRSATEAQRTAKAAEVEAARADWKRLTEAIEKIDEEKSRRTTAAASKMPVPGLGIEGDRVMLGGVPLSQASSAEQLRLGVAIGAALAPKLRVMLVRDGSLLDADGMRLLAEEAVRRDLQVWIERVATDQPCGVVIEDGRIAGDHRERAPKGKEAARPPASIVEEASSPPAGGDLLDLSDCGD